MVIVNPNDIQSQAQSPSITQETKARFNDLIKAALSKEVTEHHSLTSLDNNLSKKQSAGVSKAVPLQRLSVKSPKNEEYAEKLRDKIHAYSPKESPGNRKRQIIAEVHSSRTHLLQSSSDDDILVEKKTKKKKKKPRWKQVSESAQMMTEKERDNTGFEMEDEVVERSSSGQSNRSYILETPTIPVENLVSIVSIHDEDSKNSSPSRLSNKSYTIETPTFSKQNLEDLTNRSKSQQNFALNDSKNDNLSPSRVSNRSYTIEIPTVPSETGEKADLTLMKTPIPLPRRKSLKSPEVEQFKTSDEDQLNVDNVQTDTVITIFQSHVDDNAETPRAEVKFQQSHSQHTEDDSEIPLGVRKQKRKKKRRKRSKSREEIELQELLVHGEKSKFAALNVDETKSTPSIKSLIEATENLEKKPVQLSSVNDVLSEGIVGVTIHGVDCAIVNPLVRHPMVCLYVVDTSVGELYRKSDPGRSVCYKGENISYVLPIMTHMFDFKQRKSVVPAWEECLLLNESPSHLLTPNTLLLFELCDVLPVTVASMRHATLGGAAGRHVMAWAFLRPAASQGPQMGVRFRLQLYKPGVQSRKARPLTPAVYEWWGSAARVKYPGSLYVTVAQLAPATPPSPRLRSQSALQAERGSQTSTTAASTSATGSPSATGGLMVDEQTGEGSEVQWSRLPGQSCKVPNACIRSLPVEGSMSLQFSGNGLWLACGRQDIQVYSVPQWQHTTTLTGHQGLVYCLRWSPDSKVLLSASADCTVCVWRPLCSRNPLQQMLAHPSFVYCVEFVRPHVLVSGCCDAGLRVWKGESHNYQLTQELLGHSGFVSSVSTTVDNSKVISADSQGSLRVYDVEDDGSLSAGRDLRVRELRGCVISNVVAHPGGHRLLVHSRDSTVRSVDLATGAVLQTFKGCTSERMQTGVCVSACGSLVFGCGEDGALVAWNCNTGALRALYCGLLPPGCASVHYHPHEHLLAAAGLSQPPLHILGFDRNATGEDIGLHVLKNDITAADVIETMKLIKTSNKWQKAASKVIHTSTVTTDKGLSKNKKKKKKNGNPEEASEKQARVNWPSLPQLECVIEQSEEKDLRLLGIIRRMDNIILAAKQSSQVQQ